MNVSLEESYRHCRQLARRASSSFYWSFRLLPFDKRRAMCALYAFSRHTDDLGDSDLPAELRKTQLEAWLRQLHEALGGATDDPLLPALADAARRYAIPREYLTEIVRGVMMDVAPLDIETTDQLDQYCYRVASCVGLACIHIWGFDDDAILQPAIRCGQAFQLTNILRDLHEDADRGRCYLPREDLRRFGVDAAAFRTATDSGPLRDLLRFELQRAERLYGEAEATGRYLSGDGQRIFGMMFSTYHGLLQELKRHGPEVLRRRVRLPLASRLAIAARYAWPWSIPAIGSGLSSRSLPVP